MHYEFSWLWFVIGLIVFVAGAVFMKYYQKLADIMAGGVSSYRNFQIFGLVMLGLGLIFMLNLHSLLLNWLAQSLFGGVSSN
jgi:hypothetical protein